ncbi:uncharacterized protein SAPINGB_P001430 [Magnusiomyces paraingens]|uniref:Uncharacterized protein n=1 Tax=Magnusiomyces paraingens TaxID=2606893 RepID=A0A5E8B5W1_9ASCO|nr:uncharacterized protein SAPINGB_P001430 [Saprochaete ingens]VVT46873.1 unnamed protein product [Saprochaete ingens]
MEVYSPPIARESRKRDFRNIWNAIRGKDPTDKHQHLGDKKNMHKSRLRRVFSKREPSKKKSPVALFLQQGQLATGQRRRRRRKQSYYYLASENAKMNKKNRRRLELVQKQERRARDRLRQGKRVRRHALKTQRPSALLGAPENLDSEVDYDITSNNIERKKSIFRQFLARHRRRRQEERGSKKESLRRNRFRKNQRLNRHAILLNNNINKNNANLVPPTVDELAKDVEKTISTASYIQKKRSSLNPVTRLRARILEHYMKRKRDAVVALVKAPIELVLGRNEQVSRVVQFAVDAAQAPIWWYFGGGRRGLKNLRHGRIFGRGDAYLFDCPLFNNRYGMELRESDEYADTWLNKKNGRYNGKKRHKGRRRTLGAVKSVVKHTSRGIGGKIFKPKKVEPRHKFAVFAEW